MFLSGDGRLIGRDHFFSVWQEAIQSTGLSSFLKQFYAGTPFIPSEIMLQTEIEDGEIIEDWLSEGVSSRFTSVYRKKGTKRRNW